MAVEVMAVAMGLETVARAVQVRVAEVRAVAVWVVEL